MPHTSRGGDVGLVRAAGGRLAAVAPAGVPPAGAPAREVRVLGAGRAGARARRGRRRALRALCAGRAGATRALRRRRAVKLLARAAMLRGQRVAAGAASGLGGGSGRQGGPAAARARGARAARAVCRGVPLARACGARAASAGRLHPAPKLLCLGTLRCAHSARPSKWSQQQQKRELVIMADREASHLCWSCPARRRSCAWEPQLPLCRPHAPRTRCAPPPLPVPPAQGFIAVSPVPGRHLGALQSRSSPLQPWSTSCSCLPPSSRCACTCRAHLLGRVAPAACGAARGRGGGGVDGG